MLSNRFAFAALGGACIMAAGVGGYLATRQGASVPASVAAAAASTAAVEETEAALDPLEPIESPAPPAAAAPRPMPSGVGSVRAPSPRARHADKSASQAITTPPAVAPLPAGSPTPEAPPSPATPTSIVDATPSSPPVANQGGTADPLERPDPVSPAYDELVVSADSVIGLRIETAVSTERAQVEDRVEARVIRDVRVGGAVAIPAGSRAIGSVMAAERGGRLKDRARLGIRFHTLVLADGTRVPISTETIYRNGDAPGNASAAKIGGGAAAGAILGAIIGGAKGAAIGGSIGAGAGSASVMTGDRNAATFPAGAEVNARIVAPATVVVQHR
jgi:hypothetical protein